MSAIWQRYNDKIDPPEARCQADTQNGPCPYKHLEGTKYCARHGANVTLQSKKEQELKNYRLTKWKARVGELSSSEGIKSLREEIGILRMILEEMLNQCKDNMDLLLYSSKMSDLVMKIEKLVVSCDKLENRMGLLLSKGSVLYLAQQYVQIITEVVEDPGIIEEISTRILDVTESVGEPGTGNVLEAQRTSRS